MEIQNQLTHNCLFITINSHMFILQLYTLLPSNNTTIPKYTVTIEICAYISDSWTVLSELSPFCLLWNIYCTKIPVVSLLLYHNKHPITGLKKKIYNHNKGQQCCCAYNFTKDGKLVFRLYHDQNKLHFNEIMMKSALYYAQLDLYSASSLKQHSAGRYMLFHSNTRGFKVGRYPVLLPA